MYLIQEFVKDNEDNHEEEGSYQFRFSSEEFREPDGFFIEYDVMIIKDLK